MYGFDVIVSPLNLLLYLSIESLIPALFSIGTGSHRLPCWISNKEGYENSCSDCRRILCSSNVPSVFSIKLIWKSPSEPDSKNPDQSHYHAVN